MPETVDRESLWVEPKAEAMFDSSKDQGEPPEAIPDQQLDRFLQKRYQQAERERGGETREQREARRYREMTDEQERQRREYNRHQWVAFHRQQAERWRRTLQEVIEHHEQQAEKYSNLPIGA